MPDLELKRSSVTAPELQTRLYREASATNVATMYVAW